MTVSTAGSLLYNKDSLFYHSRNDPNILQINKSKKTISTSRSGKTGHSTELPGTSEWVAPLCVSHPSTDNTQSQLPRKTKQNKKCEPQTCLYPFHVNKTTWCYCQPLLTLLPARPVTPITQQGQEERERKNKEKEKQKEKGGGGAVGVYLSQRRPVYPGGQLSQVG